MKDLLGLVGRMFLVLSLALGFWLAPADGQAREQPADIAAPFEDDTILLSFHESVPDEIRDAIERWENTLRDRVIGADTHVLRVGKGQVAAKIAALKKHPEVRYAEPNYIVQAIDLTPNDPSYGLLWGLNNTGQTVNGTAGKAGADIKAAKAWSVTTGTRGVVVGVVDTGIDYSHVDLAANVWSNSGGIGGCAAGTRGYNAITGSCDPKDDNYHGTHVAGTIGGVGNNGTGVVGVNWTASLMALKFLNSWGSGSTADAIEAIDFAIKAKQAGVNVRVLNASWGGGGFSQALLDEINKAGNNDMLFVASAGNNTANNDSTAAYPCSYGASAPSLICVAATDQNDNLASFSNYGASSVHLGAPGVNVYSTSPGGRYRYLNGTSMATPHVAGSAALILAAGNLSTADLKARILNSVDPISALSGKTTTGGRLNVCTAIPGCSSTPTPTVPGAPTLSGSAGNAVVHLTWSAPSDGGSPITNYLVYRGTSAGGESLLATLGNVTSYDDNGVTNGTAYYYKVSAKNTIGEGSLSNEISVTPQVGTPPSAPRNLTARTASLFSRGVRLSWSAPSSSGSSAITGYRIYRGTSSGGETLLTSVGTVTSFQDTSTVSRVRYYYKITATNAAGESPPSNEANATAR